MAMTIKNQRVLEKIRELAGSLDTDQVTAVEKAVDRMAAELAGSLLEQRLGAVLGLAAAIHDALPEDALETESLYDDTGLPR